MAKPAPAACAATAAAGRASIAATDGAEVAAETQAGRRRLDGASVREEPKVADALDEPRRGRRRRSPLRSDFSETAFWQPHLLTGAGRLGHVRVHGARLGDLLERLGARA